MRKREKETREVRETRGQTRRKGEEMNKCCMLGLMTANAGISKKIHGTTDYGSMEG